MFVRSKKNHGGQWSQPLKHAPVVVLRLRMPSAGEWYTVSYATVDGFFLHFMVLGDRFIYNLEDRSESLVHSERGEFSGFDCVSAVFGGLRFHWTRESGKIIISDALAGRRDFDSLTIE